MAPLAAVIDYAKGIFRCQCDSWENHNKIFAACWIINVPVYAELAVSMTLGLPATEEPYCELSAHQAQTGDGVYYAGLQASSCPNKHKPAV